MGQVGTTFSRYRVPIGAGFTILDNDTVAVITGGGTSSGYAQAGAALTTLRAIGIATGAFYDAYGNKLKMSSPTATPGANTTAAGYGTDGAILAEVQTSNAKGGGIATFIRKNGTSADACTQADCGSQVYMLDNVTVSRVASGKSVIGRLVSINGDGTLNIAFPVGGG